MASPQRQGHDLLEWALDGRDAALDALDRGDTGRARERADHALAMLETAGSPAVETAAVRLALAEIHEAAGDLDAARGHAEMAASLLGPPAAGPDGDRLRLWCQAQSHLGDLDRQRGDLAAAQGRLARVVEAAEALPDPEELIAALNALGIVGKYAARFDDAEAAYGRALTLAESAPEPDRAVLAGLFHNLGGLEHARGRAEPGIVWAERGLGLREEIVGANHPDTAADLGALGALYQLAGRLAEAGAAYRRALAVFEAAYGPDHYEVGMTIANLAVLAGDEDSPADAVSLGRRAIAILEDNLGRDHPEVGLTLYNLAIAHSDMGDHGEATVARQRALGILTAALPAGHPQLDVTRRALAALGEPAPRS